MQAAHYIIDGFVIKDTLSGQAYKIPDGICLDRFCAILNEKNDLDFSEVKLDNNVMTLPSGESIDLPIEPKTTIEKTAHLIDAMKKMAFESGDHTLIVPEEFLKHCTTKFTSQDRAWLKAQAIPKELYTVDENIKIVPSADVELKKDHLVNCYPGKNHLRSGVIDTETKKNEWLNAIHQVDKIFSLQLNGVGETKMIDNQQRLLKDKAIHIVMPTNRWVNFIQDYLAWIPIFGWVVDRYFLKGEAYAHHKNKEGWSQVAKWLGDLPGYDVLKQAQKNKLQEVYQALQTIKKDDEPLEITLFRKILAAQLGKVSLSRGQELMMTLVLMRKMGAFIAINCKSGLDRTGLVHAILKSLPEDDNEAFKLANEWDSLKRKANKLCFKNNKWPTNLKGEMPLVADFREKVLKELITEGLPITGRSTGVMGLKWVKKFAGIKFLNLIALDFLPPNYNNDVPLVEYSWLYPGKINDLTKEGYRLLVQRSAMRGA